GVIHHKDFSRYGRNVLYLAIIACLIGGISTALDLPVTIFRVAFSVVYFGVAWICLEAVRIPELRGLIKQGYETTMRITAMVAFILIGSTCFSVVFMAVHCPRWL